MRPLLSIHEREVTPEDWGRKEERKLILGVC